MDGAGNSHALATVDHLSSQATNITFGSTTISIPADSGCPVMVLAKYDDTGAVKWAQLMGGRGEVNLHHFPLFAEVNYYDFPAIRSSPIDILCEFCAVDGMTFAAIEEWK